MDLAFGIAVIIFASVGFMFSIMGIVQVISPDTRSAGKKALLVAVGSIALAAASVAGVVQVRKAQNEPRPSRSASSNQRGRGNSAPRHTGQPDALTKMTVVFQGSYSKGQIKRTLDKAMKLYGLPISEENYSRAGSVLVALRKEYGVEEIAILNFMIESHVPGANLDFPDGAAIATVFLTTAQEK